jgi:hypothetical protein
MDECALAIRFDYCCSFGIGRSGALLGAKYDHLRFE